MLNPPMQGADFPLSLSLSASVSFSSYWYSTLFDQSTLGYFMCITAIVNGIFFIFSNW